MQSLFDKLETFGATFDVYQFKGTFFNKKEETKKKKECQTYKGYLHFKLQHYSKHLQLS